MEKPQRIGNVQLDWSYYSGHDFYNEGDEEETAVLEILKAGISPTEALAKDYRWPVYYQLSPRRECIIAPMDIQKTDKVLEIGAGMGAVTGAIAKKAGNVDCVELSGRRSLANAYRNHKYENIKIYVGNFQQIPLSQQYDVITLIGVLEYAQSYIEDKEPYETFLKQISNLLKPGGKLYIAIENRLGLKYLAGCNEDHLGKPFAGIEGYNAQDIARTFTKSELTALLNITGFDYTYFYYPFPDYKLPNVIFSDDYMPNESFVLESYNLDMDRIRCFDEIKAYRSLIHLEEIKILANSFLVEAIKNENSIHKEK